MDINIIYLVTPTYGYWDGMLEGFATDAEGVEQIVRDHYREYFYTELTDVRVDMDDFTVVVVVSKDDYEQTYYIREISRPCEEQE